MHILCLFKHKLVRTGCVYVGISREKSNYTVMGFPVYITYNYFDETHTCSRCGKKKVIRTKHPVNETASVLY